MQGGQRGRDELLECYTRAKRLALVLYNEYEHPSSNELPEEYWSECKKNYERAKELSRVEALDSATRAPLNMTNPWEIPTTITAETS